MNWLEEYKKAVTEFFKYQEVDQYDGNTNRKKRQEWFKKALELKKLCKSTGCEAEANKYWKESMEESISKIYTKEERIPT
jgi:hypothetical protein